MIAEEYGALLKDQALFLSQFLEFKRIYYEAPEGAEEVARANLRRFVAEWS